MKYILCLTALSIFAISCNSHSQKIQTEVPKGIPINASGFARISTAINADVHIEVNPDSPYQCYLQCAKDVEALIAFDILNDELRIAPQKNKQINTNQPIIIDMRVKELKSIASNGNGNIDIMGRNDAAALEIKNTGNASIKLNSVQSNDLSILSSGNGDITLNGKTKNLNARITGSGNINAYQLMSEKAVTSVLGSGNIELYVSAELNASIVGSGNIYYKGTPVIKNNITGSGLLSAK